MDSATLLTLHDRCARAAYWAHQWQAQKMHPSDMLRQAVEIGLTTEEDDPGQAAGDQVMTLAAERGIKTAVDDLYGCGVHHAAMADLITHQLRSTAVCVNSPWARPQDVKIGEAAWQSSAFLDASGVRLRQVALVSQWNPERRFAETHSWYTFGEVCAYKMPMTLTVCMIGQAREGRHHVPWAKGWVHTVGKALRFRRKGGQSLSGMGWDQVWREQTEFSREKWLDAMREDGVLDDVLFEVEIPVPVVASKVGRLAEKKLGQVAALTATPDPCPSQCFGFTPCQYADACWQFTAPSERLGFMKTLHPAQ